MKHLFLACLFLLATSAFAAEVECPSDGGKLVDQIQAQTSCYEAAKLARACAWGSSFDVHVAGAASDVCAKDFKKMSGADKKVMDYMNRKCAQKYAKMQGTMYISMAAFCQLQASEYWSEIYSPVE